MDRLKCKACDTYSVIMVSVENDVAVAACGAEKADTYFYKCRVCGDDWRSVNEKSLVSGARVSFIHGVDIRPYLIRVADVPGGGLSTELWQHYVGDELVAREEWHKKLSERRKILKAIVCN